MKHSSKVLYGGVNLLSVAYRESVVFDGFRQVALVVLVALGFVVVAGQRTQGITNVNLASALLPGAHNLDIIVRVWNGLSISRIRNIVQCKILDNSQPVDRCPGLSVSRFQGNDSAVSQVSGKLSQEELSVFLAVPERGRQCKLQPCNPLVR